ncbi:MAG TPA: class I SAM-dependent methyltransferase [Bacteroides sp.]|nr:class I SAM-dependent methyltransferase [Bacteroides sp.]
MMSKWILKAVVQKSISYLPGSEKINYLFQKYVTRGVDLTDEHFGHKIRHASDHLRFLDKYAGLDRGHVILELGTGWYPVVPVMFYLSGAGRIISVDIHSWINRENQIRTFRKFQDWRTRGLLDDCMPRIHEDRWEKLVQMIRNAGDYNMEQINEAIGLRCVKQDARALELDDDSIDFVCSNNTLEHVDREHLYPIFREFVRVLKPSGVMSHFIDMSDHFAHLDRNITIYNFLQYGERQWKCIDNRIQPQNRLRLVDYRKMYSDTGIPVTDAVITGHDEDALDKIRIHPEFGHYSREELAVSHAYLVSRMSEQTTRK